MNRLYRLVEKHAGPLGAVPLISHRPVDFASYWAKEKILIRKTHQTLNRVTNDFEARWHFNTSIALIMELVNELYAQEPLQPDVSPEVLKRIFAVLAQMLFPVTPHISSELWEILGEPDSISRTKWPAYDENLTQEEQLELIIQINGRLRGKALVDNGLDEKVTLERALADPRIAGLVFGKTILKTIVVPNKLVNIVLK